MTITATTYETFPRCPTYGFKQRPQYFTKITGRAGGSERRDRKWQEPLHWYEGAPLGNARSRDMERVRDFFHAMGGDHQAFRFKDWADFKSCGVTETPTPADQPFVALGGSAYQLVKQYRARSTGGPVTVRTICLPKGDTIRVQNQSGVEQASSTWNINEDTGVLTTLGGFSGTPGAWGGEFYARCRFAADLELEIVNHEILSCIATLKELRPEDA